jgi:hypothetical protein
MKNYYCCSYKLSNDNGFDLDKLFENIKLDDICLCTKEISTHKFFNNCILVTINYNNQYIKFKIFKNGTVRFNYLDKENNNIYVLADQIMNLLCSVICPGDQIYHFQGHIINMTERVNKIRELKGLKLIS